jgi:hypothetical protein
MPEPGRAAEARRSFEHAIELSRGNEALRQMQDAAFARCEITDRPLFLSLRRSRHERDQSTPNSISSKMMVSGTPRSQRMTGIWIYQVGKLPGSLGGTRCGV